MNKGKAKCERLKKIRKAVADRLHVDLHQTPEEEDDEEYLYHTTGEAPCEEPEAEE